MQLREKSNKKVNITLKRLIELSESVKLLRPFSTTSFEKLTRAANSEKMRRKLLGEHASREASIGEASSVTCCKQNKPAFRHYQRIYLLSDSLWVFRRKSRVKNRRWMNSFSRIPKQFRSWVNKSNEMLEKKRQACCAANLQNEIIWMKTFSEPQDFL